MLNQKSGDVMIPLERTAMGAYTASLGAYFPAMGAYLAVPDKACRGSILLIQEIFGVTPAMRAIADDYAREGYTVLVPDIYWRIERNLDLGNGEDPSQRDEAVRYSTRYNESLGTDDLVAAAEWLRTASGVSSKPALMGFCLGGRMAVRVAAKADFACMVSMYGVGLTKLAPEISATRCAMQFHYGDNDNHNSPAAIDEVRSIVASRQRRDDEFFVYTGAEHAFYNRFRLDRFNPDAHQLARQRVLTFFEHHLSKQP
jgi:carboxymethylenebutenolidase